MVIDMDDEQMRTLADVRGFLDGTVALDLRWQHWSDTPSLPGP